VTPNQKLRIILITACSRSGTTILDNILGQAEGFFSGGELVDFWHVAQANDRLCACGTRLRDCTVWGRIFRKLDADIRLCAVDKNGLREHYRYLRLRHLWRLTTRSGRRRFLELAAGHAQKAVDLYRLIAEETGAHTIVDSSKSVERTYLLSQVSELDVYVVHLVRDARAVAFSSRRRKPDPSVPNSFMQTYSPANSTIRWILSQQVEHLCKVEGRYLLIRYEDFVAAPDVELRRIFTMIGEPSERWPKVTNRTVRLDCVHSINGNANRFRQGPVSLRLDDEWRSQMSGFDRTLVNALAWRLLKRYGYELNGAPYHQGLANAN
jgi:hypothetical protein